MERSEENNIRHSNLLRAIANCNGSQVVINPERKEVSKDISEYSIRPSAAKSLLYTLCGSFKSNGLKLHSKLSKTASLTAFESAVLANDVSRQLRFRKLKETLNRWNPTIHHMRNEEQLRLPLKQGTLLTNSLENTSAFKTDVCKHLEKQETDSFVNKGSQLKEEHELSIADVLELHKEKARFNAQYSYMLAKAAKFRKIKSKKYHRMLKRKEITYMKSLAALKKADPLKAEQLLESIERKRAKERATLRHRSTAHWARFATRANQNLEWMKQLIQEIFRNCEVIQKPNATSSSEDESEKEEKNNRQAVSNPWISNSVILEEDTSIVSGKVEAGLHSNKQDALFQCNRVKFEAHLEKSIRKNNMPSNLLDQPSKYNELAHDSNTPPPLKRNETLNPDAFIEMKSWLLQLRDPCTLESSNSSNTEDSEIGINTIDEAFANDDIVAEFKENEHISKTSQLENNDSSVPGWGKWSGNSSKISVRKPKQAAVTHNRVSFAKYKNKKDVIITEDKTDKLKEQQVNEIPFSFTQMKDYEASIRFPLGNTWAPHTAHNKLVAPSLITKLGTVIKPIQQDDL